MHMPKAGMVVMDGCDPLHFFVESLFKHVHRFFGHVPQGQVFACVFPFGVGINHQAEKDTPLLRTINHPVCLPSLHCPISIKERPGQFLPVFSWPVFNIADVCFCSPAASCVGGFDNCHVTHGSFLPSPSIAQLP